MRSVAPQEPVPIPFLSEGLALTCHQWGSPDAPPLLLVHGVKDHARSWDAVARALCGRWRVLALDLRGHGDSQWSPDGAYLLPYHMLDCVALVQTLGLTRLSIVAHSLGGGIAARYAALYPESVERLVLVDGFGPSPRFVDAWEKQGPIARSREWVEKRRDPRLAEPRVMVSLDEAIARLLAANPRLRQEQAHHLALHGARRSAGGYVWKYDPRVGLFAPEDFALHPTRFWSGITAPTLLLHPAESWTTNPEDSGAAGLLADHRTLVFEGAGHWLHHDRTADFIDVLDDFL